VRAISAFFFPSFPRPFSRLTCHISPTASFPFSVLLFSLSAFPPSFHSIFLSFVFGFFCYSPLRLTTDMGCNWPLISISVEYGGYRICFFFCGGSRLVGRVLVCGSDVAVVVAAVAQPRFPFLSLFSFNLRDSWLLV